MASTSLLGVDIGGTSIKWVESTSEGRVLREGTVDTPRSGPDGVIDAVCGIVCGVGALQGIGVAIPGHVDTQTGTTILIPNIPGEWGGFPFAQRLGARLEVPVNVINDARAFATAELAIGAARASERAAFVTIGTGIGGALALDGRVLRNRIDGVGEIGHSTVVRDGELCGCGNLGCAEAYAGVRAMTTHYLPARGRDSHRAIQLLREAYDSADAHATSVVDTATWALGCAIANTCTVLGISTVVIGGGLGVRWPEFTDEIRRQLASRHALIGDVAVHISLLGDVAGALGAALSVVPNAQPQSERTA